MLDAHRPTLETVFDCADAVAASFDGGATTDRQRVVPPFRTVLREADALEALVGAWAESLSHAGYDLPARPVAEPPYVVVTSVGVVLRATISEGRLVATLRTFDVDPYERAGTLPEALTVEHRGL
nr:hypothetical protein [Natronomonas gomsonensis]